MLGNPAEKWLQFFLCVKLSPLAPCLLAGGLVSQLLRRRRRRRFSAKMWNKESQSVMLDNLSNERLVTRTRHWKIIEDIKPVLILLFAESQSRVTLTLYHLKNDRVEFTFNMRTNFLLAFLLGKYSNDRYVDTLDTNWFHKMKSYSSMKFQWPFLPLPLWIN